MHAGVPSHLPETIPRGREQHAHAPREGLASGDVLRAVDEVGALALHDLDGRVDSADHDCRTEALPELEDRTVLLIPFFEFAVCAAGVRED